MPIPTVERFVANWFRANIFQPKILFVTENCPNLKNYFYRSLNNTIVTGNHNLLGNLCRTMRIPGNTETQKLNEFLKRKYFLIDTHQNGIPVQNALPHLIVDLYNVITGLDPQQIVFTCVGTNTAILDKLLVHANNQPGYSDQIHNRLVQPVNSKNKVFNSPSNRAYSKFHTQIIACIKHGTLIP